MDSQYICWAEKYEVEICIPIYNLCITLIFAFSHNFYQFTNHKTIDFLVLSCHISHEYTIWCGVFTKRKSFLYYHLSAFGLIIFHAFQSYSFMLLWWIFPKSGSVTGLDCYERTRNILYFILLLLSQPRFPVSN